MRVAEIMSTNVQTIRPEESLRDAARLMAKHDCGCLPVIDARNELLGVLTDRDICLCAAERDEPLRKIQVSDAVSWEALSCHPDEEVENAELKLANHQIRRLPVLDEKGNLRGMLSLGDIALAAADSPKKKLNPQGMAATVAAISRPSQASMTHH